MWPDIIEHDGVFITMPPEWYIESPKHCAKRVSQVQQFFSEGRGLSEPVVYMNQKFQVIDGEFKVVSCLADIICFFFFIYIYFLIICIHGCLYFCIKITYIHWFLFSHFAFIRDKILTLFLIILYIFFVFYYNNYLYTRVFIYAC